MQCTLLERKPVLAIDSLIHFVAVKCSSKLGAEEEGSRVLPKNGVALFWWGSEAVTEEDWDHLVYLGCGVLSPKIEDAVMFERLSKKEGCLVVSF